MSWIIDFIWGICDVLAKAGTVAGLGGLLAIAGIGFKKACDALIRWAER